MSWQAQQAKQKFSELVQCTLERGPRVVTKLVDDLMAATAKVRNITFVTRNTSDVAGTDVRLLNPFDYSV